MNSNRWQQAIQMFKCLTIKLVQSSPPTTPTARGLCFWPERKRSSGASALQKQLLWPSMKWLSFAVTWWVDGGTLLHLGRDGRFLVERAWPRLGRCWHANVSAGFRKNANGVWMHIMNDHYMIICIVIELRWVCVSSHFGTVFFSWTFWELTPRCHRHPQRGRGCRVWVRAHSMECGDSCAEGCGIATFRLACCGMFLIFSKFWLCHASAFGVV